MSPFFRLIHRSLILPPSSFVLRNSLFVIRYSLFIIHYSTIYLPFPTMNKAKPATILTDFDITLLQGGTHCRLYEKLGAHAAEKDGEQGMTFAVYAPAARR